MTAARRRLLPWVILWLAAVATAGGVVGLRAAFALGYRRAVWTEVARFDPADDPADVGYALADLQTGASVEAVRARMARFGPLVGDPADESQFVCALPAVGRPTGWRIAFTFAHGRLAFFRYMPLDNPILTRWRRWADDARLARAVVDWLPVAAAVAALTTAAFAWPYRRPLGQVAAAAAVVAATAALLSDDPSQTFRPGQDWHPAAVPLALLAVSVVFVLAPSGRRHVPGVCDDCGYDLTGNVTGVCPECGTPAVDVLRRLRIDAAVAALADLDRSDNAGDP